MCTLTTHRSPNARNWPGLPSPRPTSYRGPNLGERRRASLATRAAARIQSEIRRVRRSSRVGGSLGSEISRTGFEASSQRYACHRGISCRQQYAEIMRAAGQFAKEFMTKRVAPRLPPDSISGGYRHFIPDRCQEKRAQ